MTHRLHLVFVGELVDLESTTFRDTNALDIIGIFLNYETAHAAWKNAAQRTVDNAHMRYFIADLHKLRDKPSASDPDMFAASLLSDS